MPIIKINGAELFYKLIDSGKEETVVFSNSLGTRQSMWAGQEEALRAHFNLLFYDTRGHGQSETTPGEYSAELLGADVLQLTAQLGITHFHFCGLSMGGLIGQWLALNGGSRIEKVILCNTSPKIGDKESWNDRIDLVRREGLDPVAANTAGKWFTDDFIHNEIGKVEAVIRNFKQNSAAGYQSNCAMVRDADFREKIQNIENPVLLIAGSEDPVTTADDAREMQNQIKNAELVNLKARHLSAYERPQEFNEAVLNFLLSAKTPQ